MADEENKKTEEEPEQQEGDKKSDSTDKKSLLAGLLPWIIMAVVVIVCAGSGIGLARLFAGSSESDTTEPVAEQQQEQADPFEELKADSSKTGAGSIWYYPLQPVVANLNEPGATRYIRATLTLGISAKMDQEKGIAFLDEKKPILINWLTIYLSNLTINDATGAANLRRIQSQILDAFNEELLPNSKPLIEKIFITEFAIQ